MQCQERAPEIVLDFGFSSGMRVRGALQRFEGPHQARADTLQRRSTEGQGSTYPIAFSSAPRRSRIPQTFYQVTVVWKHLAHPNIVPLLGATINPLQLISDRMPGGDLTEYISNHPETDRTSLVSGLSALLYERLTPSSAV